MDILEGKLKSRILYKPDFYGLGNIVLGIKWVGVFEGFVEYYYAKK